MSKFNKVYKKIIVSMIVVALGFGCVKLNTLVKADNVANEDLAKMKRDTKIQVDSSGDISFERNINKYKTMGKEDSWTIMIYMDGSDLEMCYGNATMDLKEIMSAKIAESTIKNVNILVQTGGSSIWYLHGIDGEKSQRFKIESIGGPTLIEEFDRTPMGDADTLYNFLKWGVDNYPAEHMGVIFWNHGGGVSGGVCTEKQDSLMVPELEYAFSKVSKDMTDTFELIGFDTCLSGSLEYASALAPYGKYMVASANTEPGLGWNYKDTINCILENNDVTGDELGKVICDSYYETLRKKNPGSRLTLATYDLSKVDDVCIQMNKLGKYMYENVSKSESDYNRLEGMQVAPERITYGENKENMDIGSLLYYFDTTSSYNYDTAVFRQALDNMITYKRLSRVYEDYKGLGLSIYYPSKFITLPEFAVMRNVTFSPYFLKYLEYMSYKRGGTTTGEFNTNKWESSDCFYEDTFEFLSYYKNTRADETNLVTSLSNNSKYVQDGFIDNWKRHYGKGLSRMRDMHREGDNFRCLVEKNSELFDRFILPDGQELTTYVEVSLGEVIYSIPVVINDIEMTIKIKEELGNNSKEYSLLGVWDATANSDYEGRGYMPLKKGSNITPIYDVYNEEEGIYESEYGEEYTIQSEFDFLIEQ